MIRHWNEVVGPNDDVYHLGDFAFRNVMRVEQVLRELNGKIHMLILPWHHDKMWIKRELRRVVDRNLLHPLAAIHILRHPDYGKITLSHYPFESWEASFHGSIHLHGHCHGTLRKIKNRWDVGIDCNDFRPISLERAVELARE